MCKKMICPISPFENQRREREGDKTRVFVNYKDYGNWVSPNNCIIKGSRGTGKSSVLATMAYQVRWLQPELIKYSSTYKAYEQVANNPQENAPIGLLFRCDKVEVNMWNKWKENNQDDHGLLFSTYLSFFFVKKILRALIEISDKFKEEFSITLNSGTFVTSVYEKCLLNAKCAPTLYDCSVKGVIIALEEMCTMIRQSVYSFTPKNTIDASIQYLSPSCNFLAEFCEFLVSQLPQLEGHAFFLLFDDVDRLAEWQMKVLNTFAKVSTSPCFYKFSTTKECASKVTIDDVPISVTDIVEYRLNDEDAFGLENDKKRIDELYSAIFQMRLETVGLSYDRELRALFGTINLECIVKKMLRSSKNPQAQELLRECGNDNVTDYWLKKNGILLGARASSKTFDKYRANAATAIASKFNLKKNYLYYSYDVIRALCCGSPRHFLQICNALWQDIYTHITNVSSTIQPIPCVRQNMAIRMVSKNLYNNLDDQQVDFYVTVSYKEICSRLANVFDILTTDVQSLRISQECLSVEFDINDIKDELYKNEINKIIDHLTMVEAIKVISLSNGGQKIALNPMLAPSFCLPYRSPFMNSCHVDGTKLYVYLFGKQECSPKNLLQKRLSNQQPLLF